MDASVRSMLRVPRNNPRNKAGLFSKLFFLWLVDIIRSGNTDDFEEDDIPEATNDHKSEILSKGLERTWKSEMEKAQKNRRQPSFVKAIMNKFGLEFLLLCLVSILKDLISTVVIPQLLGLILQFFTPDSRMSHTDALLVALALCVSSLVAGVTYVHLMNNSMLLAVRVRAACITLVYHKCLRLSQSAVGLTSPGQVINLVSNDVVRFELVCFTMMLMASTPIMSVLLMYFAYRIAGPATFVGVGALVVVLLIQIFNAKLTAQYRVLVARRTDDRVRLMDEIVLGIQVIKLYAWEKPFKNFINSARKRELNILRRVSFLRGFFMFFVLFSWRLAMFCTLLVAVITDTHIDTSSVFVLMVYFNQLASYMTSMSVRGLAEVAECMVSIRRIQAFLLLDEFKPLPVQKHQKEEGVVVEGEPQAPVVKLISVSAKWADVGDMTLTDLCLDICEGQLVAVIGTVGSGKSSLLHLLLGELIKKEGQCEVRGCVSYSAQEPWVFSSSVRQNILFREDYNSSRYKAVCKVCELERDFEQLPRGDKTLVGAKGAVLSGGQKARINLARAIYKKADIYLLDDPLSAVDSHVGKHLFYKCIEEFLKDKTRILVTHQVQFLSKVNHILLMENGRIQVQGSFKELRRSHYNFASVLSTPEHEKSQFQFLNVPVTPALQRSQQRRSTRSERSVSIAGDEVVEYEEFENEREVETTTHLPSLQVYQQYLRAGVSPLYCVMVAALFLLTQALVSGYDYWIAYWLHEEESRDANNMDIWPKTCYLYVLGTILFGLLVFGVLRGLVYYEGCVRCSRGTHAHMFDALISTSLSFFHNNSSGRILNRFSRDLSATDELLAKAVMDMGQAFSQVLGGLVIAVSVNPWLLLPILVLSVLLAVARRICLKASKNIKRVEGIVRSPLYNHINASIYGLVTIRAHSAEPLLHLELSRYLDMHSSVMHLFYNIMSFLSLVQELVTIVYIVSCIFSFILFKSVWTDTSAALIITQSFTISFFLTWGIKMSAEVANQMTSIERAVEYMHLEPEEPDQEGKVMPGEGWPQVGMIEMHSVFLRYDITEPYILRNINFTILPMEKVGIVGRTGAGKSSLIAALFRLALVEGVVAVDGVDTGSVPLQQLRSHISIIPQDPVLFSGSLRTNLDPFQCYSDAELYSVLHEVKLNDNNNDMSVLSLDSQVTEGGLNFSVGQRQLVCLARAILRNNHILVLDEATANVDPQTDALIQSTIRLRFAQCTVLTVAHRLNTIIDSDRVLVMDSGAVAEFDHPHVLLMDEDSLFYSLVQQTGPVMARQLITTAEQNYKNTMRPVSEL